MLYQFNNHFTLVEVILFLMLVSGIFRLSQINNSNISSFTSSFHHPKKVLENVLTGGAKI